MKQTIEVDNKSKFTLTFIQIDEHGEWVKAKLENEHEHRILSKYGLQTVWMSAERKHHLGIV